MSKESRKFQVPDALANTYDFANSLDLRRFIHHGVQHAQGDEFQSAAALGDWMARRGLGQAGKVPSAATFAAALALRGALRDYLERDPAERRRDIAARQALDKAIARFPLRVTAGKDGLKLVPAGTEVASGLSAIVAELYRGSADGVLDRLKMCASDECKRVFFDRSKPGTRRWCQSTLCGNRQKTRAYRERIKNDA
ncbi:MAG TPA: CGNR zinc finger domain-containing protein [Bradyrhizobium sp.]|uniref:CGNR zinc finger domain-containing protein n=1 Tax=Bradyrhizobium sp. TaxID=376 RepID=UPI002D802327|nr:CGNR zinc finger domain-containing protein [Bradyrhizobium sp.]HET7888214.1 CGNR zinc finger domain-containing protein [Bradyrhizobium sp.]